MFPVSSIAIAHPSQPTRHRPLRNAILLAAGLVAMSAATQAFAGAGALDPSFGTDGIATGTIDNDFSVYGGYARGCALQSDNKPVFAGTYHDFLSGKNKLIMHRYNVNGTQDKTFGAAGTVTQNGMEGWSISLAPGGKLLISGSVYNSISGNNFAVARYNGQGALDASFGAAGTNSAAITNFSDTARIALGLSNGKTLIAGQGDQGYADSMTLVQYNAAGLIDTSFGSGGIMHPQGVAGTEGTIVNIRAQSDGKLLVLFYQDSITKPLILARYLSNGAPDMNFSTDGQVSVGGYTLTVQSDGKIVVAGDFLLRRFLPTGAPDPDFGSGGTVTTGVVLEALGSGVAVQPNGRIIVAGYNNAADADVRMERFNANGSIDTLFGTAGGVTTHVSGYDDAAAKVAVRPDGKIVLYGGIYSGGRYFLARYLGDAAAEVTGQPVANVTEYGAHLSGTVAPHGNPTTAALEYGTTKSYGQGIALPLTPDNDQQVHDVSVDLTGLLPHTTYYYRLTARNVQGADSVTGSFKTLDLMTITSPVQNATINGSFGGKITLAGKSIDSRGTKKVQISLNGGAWTDAMVTPSGAGADFSLEVQPLGGTNVVSIRVVETDDAFSAIETRTFNYIVKRTLEVKIEGGGTVSGVLKGTDPYQVGKTYTLTAKPGSGKVFNGWSGPGLSGIVTELPKLTFVFSNALAASPAITANFIDNPFVNEVTGSFNGLVLPAGATIPSQSSRGLVTLKVTAAGTFTGTLKIDGLSFPLSGLFDNTGAARFGTARATSLPLSRATKPQLILALLLDLAPGGQRVTGTLSEQTRDGMALMSQLAAGRAAFDGKTPLTSVPADYLANKGLHTIAFPAQAQTNGLTSIDFPAGDGHGSIAVTKAGAATLAATLPDGVAVTASSPLDKTLSAPLFAQLYTGKTGSLGGMVQFDKSQSDTDVKGSEFVWFKSFTGGQYYPYGWPEGVTFNLIGARYAVTPGSCVLPGPGVVSPNTTLSLLEGGLAAMLTKDADVSPANKVTKVPATDASFTLSIAAATGKVTGTFIHSGTSKVPFSGVILQKGANAKAFGYFLSPKPKVIDGAGLSGRMSLVHK